MLRQSLKLHIQTGSKVRKVWTRHARIAYNVHSPRHVVEFKLLKIDRIGLLQIGEFICRFEHDLLPQAYFNCTPFTPKTKVRPVLHYMHIDLDME